MRRYDAIASLYLASNSFPLYSFLPLPSFIPARHLRSLSCRLLSTGTTAASSGIAPVSHVGAGIARSISACCCCCVHTAPQHTSAYVSIRQHTSAAYGSSIRQHTPAYVNSKCQHTSAYVSIRQRTCCVHLGSRTVYTAGSGTCTASTRTASTRTASSLAALLLLPCARAEVSVFVLLY